MRTSRILPLLFAFLILCSLLFSLTASAYPYVRVMMTDGTDYKVVSANPVLVPYGGNVTFKIEAPAGYDLVQLNTLHDAEYDKETGTLKIKDIRYPVTFSMRMAKNPKSFRFFLENEGNGGYVGTDIKQGTVKEGTIAHIFVRVKEDYRFDGWSIGKTLAKGGKLISKAQSLEYVVKEESFLFANFSKLPRTTADALEMAGGATQTFIYYTNGGLFNGADVDHVSVEVPAVHLYQNTLPADDTFTREGYQLIEYNTKPDGTGDGYNLGSKALYTKEKTVRLYCIWAKESDPKNFKTTKVSNGLAITDYTADEETLVIPETIGGERVLQINTGAFKNKNFKTLVIPKSVTKVESKAFRSTANFTRLYMFDSMLSIANDAFTNIEGFTTLCMNAAIAPRHTATTSGAMERKYERLIYIKQTSKKPMLCVVAGSSTWYGIDTDLLNDLMGGGYERLNYGTNAGTSILLYLEIIAKYVTPGDVVIHAPEYSAQTHGGGNITASQWVHMEYNYNILREVDMRHYANYFSGFNEYNSKRVNSVAQDYYAVNFKDIDEYGDHASLPKTLQKDTYHNGSTLSFVNQVTGTRKVYLNAAYQKMLDNGATVYYSCAPANLNAVPVQYRDRAVQDAYMAEVAANVIVPVISHVADYIYEPKYMYNSDYHLGAVGREMRTRQLFADLQKYWASQKLHRFRRKGSMKKKPVSILLIAALCALAVTCVLAADGKARGTVRVMLTESDVYTVLENPVSVPVGGDAVFHIDAPEGYDMVQIDTENNATYDISTGTLTIRGVRYPETVTMRMWKDPQTVKYLLDFNVSDGGIMRSDVKQGYVPTGTIAHMTATAKEDFRFDGWSEQKTLARGGTLISREATIDFLITKDILLYANFTRIKAATPKASTSVNVGSTWKKTCLFTYNANGGTYKDTEVTVLNMDVPVVMLYQNCLAADGTFVRPGYQLIEYNTKADGSGDAYSTGSKVLIPEDEVAVLFCIWAKNSDEKNFTVANVSGGVAITGYTADEDYLVIPETIGGKNVVQINTGAFVKKNFTTLVIPRTVKRVQSKAFDGSPKFTTLYMFDSVESIPDDAFTDMSKFKNFRINAAIEPRYSYSTANCAALKFCRLAYLKQKNEKPVLVVQSGSSTLYGLNSPMFEKLLGNKYDVVNYGINANTSGSFYMEFITSFLTEGDILIHAPELYLTAMGSGTIVATQWQHMESVYNVWRLVDASHYTNIFSSLTEFNQTRLKMAKKDYNGPVTYSDSYGDLANNKKDYNSASYYGNKKLEFVVENWMSGQVRENANRCYAAALAKGVRVYVSIAPCNYNAVQPYSREKVAQERWDKEFAEAVSVPMISHVSDYIFEGKYMNNSDYHLGAIGRDIRTERLAADLTAQLKKEGEIIP